jgi:DNA-binding NtrC family response regulator
MSADPAPASILLVEDDVGLGRALAEVLRRHGYDVSVAENGRTAMEFLSRQRVALVISDIFMPEADGIELLGFLRRLTPPTPLVAMSGAGVQRVSMLRVAGALGATRTLPKPFDLAQFLGLVRELIGPGIISSPASPADPVAP